MVIIGLGNPGPKYAFTRHNVGFMVLDRIGVKWKRAENYSYCEIILGGEKNLLVKPLTYMNLSGEIFKYLKISNKDDIIVVYDDLDLPLGRIRLRKNGSAGGHNGIKSIIYYIGQDFKRLRVGIGPRPEEIDAAAFVLSEFSQEELEILDKVIDRSIEALEYTIQFGIDKAMEKFNGLKDIGR